MSSFGYVNYVPGYKAYVIVELMSTRFYFPKIGLRHFLFLDLKLGKRRDFIVFALIEKERNVAWQAVGKICAQLQTGLPFFTTTPEWCSYKKNAFDPSVDSVFGKIFQAAPGKIVVAEEATGTWCPWCVRGTVYMEELSTRYDGYFAGIAVHNADPMAFDAYDTPIGGMISGYPSGLVDRGPEYDPSQFEMPFLERIQVAPKAWIENGATWDATTRLLNISSHTTWQQAATGNYKITLVLTEDDVTGTGSQWAQANAYAGGANGPMGGYELLPSPVPANQMVYDHVARIISPSFAGMSNAFEATMDVNDEFIHNWSLELPDTWDETTMHIIVMVIAPDGTIDNASSSSIDEAVANGYETGELVSGVEVPAAPDALFSVYPNPALDACFIQLNMSNASSVFVNIYSNDGKLIATKNYGILSGASTLPVNLDGYANGLYTIELITENDVMTSRFIKE